MSRVTRQKHVLKEMMKDDFDLPNAKQQIVRVVGSSGSNLHKVESAETGAAEDTFLVSMPTKFRRNVWVKRGDYVLVEPIAEGNKVKAEICKILTAEHVKEYTKAGIWPKKFTNKRTHEDDDDDGDADMETEVFVVRNRNRPKLALNENDDGVESSDEDNETSNDEN